MREFRRPSAKYAVQSDGKVLVAFQSRLGDRFTVVRPLPGLVLDPTFGGGDGEVIPDFVTRNGASPRVALTTGGAIVAAGTDTTSAGILLARYRADGSADPTFGTGGTTVVDPPDMTETANDLAIDAAGNVVVGGNVHRPFHSPKHLLARFTPAGQLDPTFGGGGLATWSPELGDGAVRSVVIPPDGRIVAGGSALYGNVKTLAPFLPSGQLDPSFGDGGVVATQTGWTFNGLDRPDGDVVLLRDGRVWPSAAPSPASMYDPDPSDNSVTAEVLIQGGVTS